MTFEELMSRKEIISQLSTAGSTEEIQEIFKANGVTVSEDEAKAFIRAQDHGDELDETDLDLVAGGAIGIRSPDPVSALRKVIKKLFGF